MSTGFTFGGKPAGTSTFGQTPAFGSQQPGSITFGTPATTTPQFGSTFGAGTGSFQFSSPQPPTAAATALTFGSPAPSAAPGYGFGAANTGLPFGSAAQSSTLFATPASSAPSAPLPFGAPAPTVGTGFPFSSPTVGGGTGLNFGTPTTTAVANTNLPFGAVASTVPSHPSTALGFGAPAPTFGATTSAGLTFGTPATTLSVPNMGLPFGTSMPTVKFGTPAPPPVSFRAPAPAIPLGGGTLPFGTPALTGTTGLSFAAPIKPTTISGGLNLGNTASLAPTTNLTFGTTSTAIPSTGLSFGTPATSAPSTSLSFGAPAPSALTTGLSFLAPTTSTTTSTNLAFGATPVMPAPSTGLSLPSFSLAPTLSSFTTPAATTAAAISTGFGLGLTTPATTTTTTTTATTGLSFSLSGTSLLKPPAATTTTTSTGFSLTTQPTIGTATTLAQKTVGLGGISSTPPKTATTGQTELPPRDQTIPNEVLQTVENFKTFIKDQKNCSSEIARFSIKDLKTVSSDMDAVNRCINELERTLQKNKVITEKLKFDTASALQNAEMAQRTYDTPSGLQYDNTAPLTYFMNLAEQFEKEALDLKVNIENIDKFVRNTNKPATLTSEDLALGMRRIHEAFIALAGRLQAVHSKVEYQKDQYLYLRKQLLNDHTNVFEIRDKEMDVFEAALDSIAAKPPSMVITGPTPFSSLGNSQAQALAQNLPPPYPGPALGPPPASGFGTTGSNTALPFFGTTNILNTTSSIFSPTPSAFNLQKPPIGNKRGKP